MATIRETMTLVDASTNARIAPLWIDRCIRDWTSRLPDPASASPLDVRPTR